MRLATPRDPEADEVVVLRFLLVGETVEADGMALVEVDEGVAEYCRVSGAVSIQLAFPFSLFPFSLRDYWAYSGLASLHSCRT